MSKNYGAQTSTASENVDALSGRSCADFGGESSRNCINCSRRRIFSSPQFYRSRTRCGFLGHDCNSVRFVPARLVHATSTKNRTLHRAGNNHQCLAVSYRSAPEYNGRRKFFTACRSRKHTNGWLKHPEEERWLGILSIFERPHGANSQPGIV